MYGRSFYYGSDANPGSKDKPFLSVERARDEIRKAKVAGPLDGPVIVHLSGGVYRLTKTLEWLPEDSGTERAPITYAADAGQHPVISGGRTITGWQKGEGAIWQTTVPEVKQGQWYFHQLFVGGQRRTRARTPNQGYLYTEGILAPFNHAKWSDPNLKAKHGFLFREGDIKRWRDFDDALVVLYHSWTTSIHFITELDPVARSVRLGGTGIYHDEGSSGILVENNIVYRVGAGAYGDAAWVNRPKQIVRAPLPELPSPPPPPPPRPLVEDFETTAPGHQPELLRCSPDGRADVIQVTEEKAASGKRCLKLIDAAGLKHTWEPHLYFMSERYTNGRVRLSCDVNNPAEHPSEGYLCVRDWRGGGPYREGVTLQWTSDGSLLASGKKLVQSPLGRWCHLEIEIDQGKADLPAAASRTYRLTVTVAGGKTQAFEQLPYANAEFRRLTWFGFSLTGKPGAVLYVDNVRLERMSE